MLKGSYSSLRQRTGSHVRKPRRQYFGHVIRAQNLCSVRAFLKVVWVVQNCKRQRKTTDTMRDDITDWTGKILAECTTAARDWKSWREMVRRSVKVENDDDRARAAQLNLFAAIDFCSQGQMSRSNMANFYSSHVTN